MKKKINMVRKAKLMAVALLLAAGPAVNAQRKMMHPGISYTQADIDRMKAMVEARQEPFYSGFIALRDGDFYTRYRDIDREFPKDKNGNVNLCGSDADVPRQMWFDTFGLIAVNNALLWHITGDTYYADRAVRVLNRYIGIKSTWSYGTVCLNNASAHNLIEAAELMRDYSGWKAEDQQGFKDFLVYPGYSTVENYFDKYSSHTPEENRQTVYWGILNGDPDRHGNQGIYGLRTLLAMGIYLDNDTIYDRALRKMLSLPHRADDLPYPGENQTPYAPAYQDEYYESWNLAGEKIGIDYGADDELKYYFYENGQCQESSRDQGHILDCIRGGLLPMARMAWNQGDDMYTQYDDRLLKGIIFTTKYNYGWLNEVNGEQFWQGEDVFEPTVENGQYMKVRSRNKRWRCLKICPWAENGQKNWSRGKRFKGPVQMLMDYSVRLGRSDDSLLWVRRAYDMDMDSIAKTENKTIKDMLLDYRTAWMAGDGGTFDADGQHVSGLPKMPGRIKAVDYDYFNNVVSGNGRTYYNPAPRTDSFYRKEGGMQITEVGGGFAVTDVKAGSWMNYTVVFPQTGYYRLTAEADVSDPEVRVGFAVDGSEVEWGGAPVKVQAGARVIRVCIDGADNGILLKEIVVEAAEEPAGPVAYRWDSHDYSTVEGGGTFLTDRGSTLLYSTSYANAQSPVFTISADAMNYTVPTASNHLLVKGTNLSSAALRQAVYRLDGAVADVTKKVNTPQINHRSAVLDDGTVLLVWKLDSSVSSRIKPLFEECYKSAAPDYTLRGLVMNVTGTGMKKTTTVSEIGFYDVASLYEAYPALDPVWASVTEVVRPAGEGSGAVYDLQGRRVSGTPRKGIYIRNGKKFVVD